MTFPQASVARFFASCRICSDVTIQDSLQRLDPHMGGVNGKLHFGILHGTCKEALDEMIIINPAAYIGPHDQLIY